MDGRQTPGVATPDSRPNKPVPSADAGRVPAIVVLELEPEEPPRVSVAGLADTSTGQPADERTALHACSAAKLVTAVTVLRLVQDGTLGLDDDVREFLPVPVAEPADRTPTLRELLGHTGGVVDPAGSFEPTAAPSPSTADVVAGRTPAHPGPVRVTRAPGTGFEYSDAGFCLVERVVEIASGVPFAVAAHRLVSAPLGLASTGFWGGQAAGLVEDPAVRSALTEVTEHAASGHEPDGTRVPGGRQHYAGLAASGLWTTPGDLGVLLTDLALAWSGRAEAILLDEQSAVEMLLDPTGSGVGLGVFLLAGARGPCVMTQGWGSGFQCQARVYPAERGALAVLTNQNPGVDQAASVVGTTLSRLAGQRGWSA